MRRVEQQVGALKIVGFGGGGDFRARVFVGEKYVGIEGQGTTMDQVMEDVRQAIAVRTDQRVGQRRYAGGMMVALEDEFVEALVHMREIDELKEDDIRRLRILANAEGATMTATQIAEVNDYKGYQAVNAVYGALGKKIGNVLNLPVPEHESGQENGVFTGFIAWQQPENEDKTH